MRKAIGTLKNVGLSEPGGISLAKHAPEKLHQGYIFHRDRNGEE